MSIRTKSRPTANASLVGTARSASWTGRERLKPLSSGATGRTGRLAFGNEGLGRDRLSAAELPRSWTLGGVAVNSLGKAWIGMWSKGEGGEERGRRDFR
jgi:hypothetical protein